MTRLGLHHLRKARLWLAARLMCWAARLLRRDMVIILRDGTVSTGYVEMPANTERPPTMPKQPTHAGPRTWQ